MEEKTYSFYEFIDRYPDSIPDDKIPEEAKSKLSNMTEEELQNELSKLRRIYNNE